MSGSARTTHITFARDASPRPAGDAVTDLLPDLFWMAALVLVALAVLALVVVLASRALRRSVLRSGVLPDADLHAYRSEIVDAVGEASQERRTRVVLRNFWYGTGLTAAQRYVVLHDLLERGVLRRAYATDRFVAFFQHLRWDWFHRPPSIVRLSELHWQQLASGRGASIVANGDVISVVSSPGAGIVSRSTGAMQNVGTVVTPELVAQVIAAVRSEAAELRPGNTLRQEAEVFAQRLEVDARAGRWSSVRTTLSDLLAFASDGASLWVSTLALLSTR